LFNLVIGAGAVQSGSMATIDWSNDNYYLKVGMDAAGGTNFLIMGTTQLLSVPYAMYAKSAGSFTGGGTGLTPSVTTNPPTNILATSVNMGLTILNNGNDFILASGFCVNTSGTPTINNNTYSTFGTWPAGGLLTNLNPSTSYFARAFATNANGTSYGNEITFTTTSGNVIISTNSVTNVTDSSFYSGGNISSDGGSPITQRGICWSTSNTNPTLGINNYTINGAGVGSFFSQNWNCNPNTLYYVRAYAINSVGTFYGNTLSVTTLP
jgi:hypothetical protein